MCKINFNAKSLLDLLKFRKLLTVVDYQKFLIIDNISGLAPFAVCTFAHREDYI